MKIGVLINVLRATERKQKISSVNSFQIEKEKHTLRLKLKANGGIAISV